MLTLRALLGPLMACSLVACSVTLPVQGNIQSSAETFEGTATGHIDRSGELKVKTSKGVECTGKFVYVTQREGSGVFKCADGRTGPFEFSSTGMRGTGKGELDGGKFTFMFGD